MSAAPLKCAEFTWEHNPTALGKEFRVLGVDHLGFGLTDKVFDFGGQFDKRITHIRRFIEAMCVGSAACFTSFVCGRGLYQQHCGHVYKLPFLLKIARSCGFLLFHTIR